VSIEVEIGDSGERQPRKSTADRLVDLAVERYEFGCTEDREPYALDANAGHVVRMLREPSSLRSTGKSSARSRPNKRWPTHFLSLKASLKRRRRPRSTSESASTLTDPCGWI
jgi:hypothetical protein